MPEMTRRTSFAAGASAALLLGTGGRGADASTGGSGALTAYTNARLIIGDGSVTRSGTIIVKDGLIKGVGRVGVPAGAKRVNLAGKTVMPTMLDTHVHVGAARHDAVQDMRERAYWGVSAVQSLGLDSDEIYDAFGSRGKRAGAYGRIYSSGKRIDAPATPKELRQAVRVEAARGVKLFKIAVDDRQDDYSKFYPFRNPTPRDPNATKLTPEMCRVIIEEAHRLDVRVIAHVYNLADIKHLLRSGVDAIAHGVRDLRLDDEALRLYNKHPDVVHSSSFTPVSMGTRGRPHDVSFLEESLPPDEYAKIASTQLLYEEDRDRRQFDLEASNLRREVRNGVKFVVASDGNSPWGTHMEMDSQVAAGLTPMQTIVAATGDAAKFLRVTDEGKLAKGMRANFIVLDANPLDKIRNTRKISAVYLRGAAVDRTLSPVGIPGYRHGGVYTGWRRILTAPTPTPTPTTAAVTAAAASSSSARLSSTTTSHRSGCC